MPRQQCRGGPRSGPSCRSAGQKGGLQQGLEPWLSGLCGEAMLHLHPTVLVSISTCEWSALASGPPLCQPLALRFVLLFSPPP